MAFLALSPNLLTVTNRCGSPHVSPIFKSFVDRFKGLLYNHFAGFRYFLEDFGGRILV